MYDLPLLTTDNASSPSVLTLQLTFTTLPKVIPTNKHKIIMSSRCLHFLWLFALIGFARANERRLTESRGFVVAIGGAAAGGGAAERGGAPERVCIDTERDALQREVRYFIRKRARDYMNVVVGLKEDVHEDPEFQHDYGKGRHLQQSGLRNNGHVRERDESTVVYPWGGRGELECTHCDAHGESRLRKQHQSERSSLSLDAQDFEAFMDTQLTNDIQWAAKALRERQTMELHCLGDLSSVKVAFKLD